MKCLRKMDGGGEKLIRRKGEKVTFKRLLFIVMALFFLLQFSFPSWAGYVKSYTKKNGTHVEGYYRFSKDKSSYTKKYSKSSKIQRTSNGKIKRSYTVKKEFMRKTGYPNGRTGYEIDHKVPLNRGGPDTTHNMQWITPEEHKIKTRIETGTTPK